jgi:hypothetical protein
MVKHNGINMSKGLFESDMWGTIMYLGTIKMMYKLIDRNIHVPWNYSQVHRIPCNINN